MQDFRSGAAEPRDDTDDLSKRDVIADLSHFGVIEVSGVDAREFLNNQLTNDIHKLDAAHALYAGYCSPRGRLLANFLIWQQGDAAMMQLDAGLRESIQKRLAIYVLRSKVKLRDASADSVRIGIAGPRAAQLVAAVADVPANAALAVAQQGEILAVRLDEQRFQLIVASAQATQVWEKLAAQARPVGAPVWGLLEIRAGIPWITTPTQEEFVPQMVNLDRTGGLSYQKGCYPGQEIVARTHYLGKLKRRMYRVHIAGAVSVAVGGELFSAAFGGQSCGMIVNAAPAPEGGHEALAVLQIESLSSPILLGSINGLPISTLTLPYTLE